MASPVFGMSGAMCRVSRAQQRERQRANGERHTDAVGELAVPAEEEVQIGGHPDGGEREGAPHDLPPARVGPGGVAVAAGWRPGHEPARREPPQGMS
jgi:hypothetical protein